MQCGRQKVIIMFCLGVRLHTCKRKGNDTRVRPSAQCGGKAGKWVATHHPLQLGQRQGEIPQNGTWVSFAPCSQGNRRISVYISPSAVAA